MEKNIIRGILIDVILLVVFSVIAFVVPFEKTAVFWLAYVCGLLAIAVQLFLFQLAFGQKADVKSKFYGFPIARIGVIYLVAQLIVSLIEMMVAAFLPTWVVVIINVLIIAAALIGLTAADIVRDTVEAQETRTKDIVANMYIMQATAEQIAEKCSDASCRKEISKLAEEIRYSDPISNDKTLAMEADILVQLEKLSGSVSAGEYAGAIALCEKIQTALKARNQMCKAGK